MSTQTRSRTRAPAPAAGAVDLVETFERYAAAWARRDPDAIVALHTEDTQFWTRSGAEPVVGRAAVRETFAGIFEAFPEFGFVTHRVLYGADFWVLDWTLTARVDGRDIRFDALDVVNVSPDGLVARKDTFVDNAQMRAALHPADATATAAATATKEPA
jgi:ketosteroid isomerase-like protein